MKKILYFLCLCALCVTDVCPTNAAVRDGNSTSRGGTTNQRLISTSPARATTRAVSPRTTSATRSNNVTVRGATRSGVSVISRAATTNTTPAHSVTKTNTSRINPTGTYIGRSTVSSTNTARATTTASAISETRTGAEYEQCKNAYFACMDQFCPLKSDDYRRCSCSDRVYALTETRNTLQDAGQQLTVFTENLDAVGMTAAQATAMRTASEGENAIIKDTSASKSLLQAIMNSIRGDDTAVGGKYSDLNSINIAFDTANAFGMTDAGQAIAAYNGTTLYSAVYPQCRAAVKNDCNDASLQRAITAYLMAIEQDCNTVQTAIETMQKQMKSALREGSAMLDLARVENRQKHNSDDITTCINNVESAILSEEVCGANYHKCLDNGEFIDITTGQPIAGVKNFYELGNLLEFSTGVDTANQKLAKNPANRTFVQNFEKRTKKFAEPALDKCVEQSDTAWSEYLDRAMLAIYYAQKSKVDEIKQGCFDFVSSCYVNGDKSLTAAMATLTGDAALILQPDKITLTSAMCTDYIDSCNLMFDGKIVAEYVNKRTETDTLAACRAVVQQCFNKYGGVNYENFYYPSSGIFNIGQALDWFTLYEYTADSQGNPIRSTQPVSECARQLAEIESCNSDEMMQQAFGGFDRINAGKGFNINKQSFIVLGDNSYTTKKYGTLINNPISNITCITNDFSTGYDKCKGSVNNGISYYPLQQHEPYPVGVATETYYNIVDILTTQCHNLGGRFMELQFIPTDAPEVVIKTKENTQKTQNNVSNYSYDDLCKTTFEDSKDNKTTFGALYGILSDENMCPRGYGTSVDTTSWGACLCWENGGRRSRNGESVKCEAISYDTPQTNSSVCHKPTNDPNTATENTGTKTWCTLDSESIDVNRRLCPAGIVANKNSTTTNICNANDNAIYINEMLPHSIWE